MNLLGFFRTIGAKRVILARECDLQMAAEIAKKCGVEIEIFVHGAMCMAVLALPLLSAYLTGHSGCAASASIRSK